MKKYIATTASSLNIEVTGLNRIETFGIHAGDEVLFDGLVASYQGVSGIARSLSKAISFGWYRLAADQVIDTVAETPASLPEAPEPAISSSGKQVLLQEETDGDIVASVKSASAVEQQSEDIPNDLSAKPERVRLSVSDDDTELVSKARSQKDRLAENLRTKRGRVKMSVLEESDGTSPVKGVSKGGPAVSYDDSLDGETPERTSGVVDHEANAGDVGSAETTIPTNSTTAVSPKKARLTKVASDEVPEQGAEVSRKINSARIKPTAAEGFSEDSDITTSVTVGSGAIDTATSVRGSGESYVEAADVEYTPRTDILEHTENGVSWGSVKGWMKKASFCKKSSDSDFLSKVAEDSGEQSNVRSSAQRRLDELAG